ncbi:hypothetical protein GCM10028802_40450 [Terrabacter terrigena]
MRDGGVVQDPDEIAVDLGVGAERGARQRERPAVVRPEGCDESDDHGDEEDDVHGRKFALTIIPPRVAELTTVDKILPDMRC